MFNRGIFYCVKSSSCQYCDPKGGQEKVILRIEKEWRNKCKTSVLHQYLYVLYCIFCCFVFVTSERKPHSKWLKQKKKIEWFT